MLKVPLSMPSRVTTRLTSSGAGGVASGGLAVTCTMGLVAVAVGTLVPVATTLVVAGVGGWATTGASLVLTSTTLVVTGVGGVGGVGATATAAGACLSS